MTAQECEQLCEDAKLNVRAVTQTGDHFIAQVGKGTRSTQAVIARLRRLARDRGLAIGGIVYSQGLIGDDEIWFGVRS